MNKTQEVSELLKPRVRCKGTGKFHFPGSGFEAGEILDVAQDGARLVSIKTGTSVDWLKYKNYPHLFEEIPWWEDREVSEMPEYVKNSHGVIKIDKHFKMLSLTGKEEYEQWSHFIYGDNSSNYTFYQPATKSEYDSYLKSLTKLK